MLNHTLISILGLPLLLIPARAQTWTFTNLGTPVLYTPFATKGLTTQPILSISANTPISGASHMVTAASLAAGIGQTFTISGTNTAYDGGTFTIKAFSNINPPGIFYEFTTAIQDSYLNYYNDLPVMAKAPNGTILNFYRIATSHSSTRGVIAFKTSNDNGATWTLFGSWNSKCSGGDITAHPGCIFDDATYDTRNLMGGLTSNGSIVVFWSTYDCPSCAGSATFKQIMYSRSADNGVTWSTPAAITLNDNSARALVFTSTSDIVRTPQGDAIPLNTSGDFVSLVFSCDDGLTWGTGTGCAPGFSSIRTMPSAMPTNESAFAFAGNNRIVGFSRSAINNVITGDVSYLRFVSSNDLGTTWTITNVTSIPPLQGVGPGHGWELVSPWLSDAGLGDGSMTLFYADRSGNYLRSVSFNPAAAILNPNNFPPAQTLYTGFFTFGYPTVVETSPRNILVEIMSGNLRAQNQTENLVTLTAQYPTSQAGFALSASPLSPASLTPGQSATSTITVTPLDSFRSTVNLSCSLSRVGPGCSISPTSVAPAANRSATAMLAVSTTAPIGADTLHSPSLSPRDGGESLLTLYALSLFLGGLAFVDFGLPFYLSWKKRPIGLLLGWSAGLILMAACGNACSRGSNQTSGTPAATYTVTVVGASGSTTRTTTLILTVQ